MLAVLIAAGVMSGITVYADTEPASYIAEKVAAGDISEGDKLFICFKDSSVVMSTELNGTRINPASVAIGTDGDKNVLTEVSYSSALFTAEYSDGGALRLHADGKLNIRDATLIQMYISSITLPFPIGQPITD